jgi:hypothetical protein
MAIAIDDILAGQALGAALKGGSAAAKRFFGQDRLGRLLILLHNDFGDEADLDRASFAGWRRHEELRAGLERVLAGAGVEIVEELAPLIEQRLVRTGDAEKPPLARRLAEAALRAAPLTVREPQELGVQLSGKLDVLEEAAVRRHDQLMTAVTAANAVGDSRGQSDLARALLVGPLRESGQEARVAGASRLVEQGRPAEAAEELVAAADALDAAGFDVVAEGYRSWAARLFQDARDSNRAAALLGDVTRAQIARGASALAWSSAHALLRTAPADQRWLAEALLVLAAWPELDTDDATAVLATAVARTRGTTEELEWRAAQVELLALQGGNDALLEAAGGLPEPLAGGARLQLELDLLEAVERRDGAGAVESRWREVLRWADSDAAPEHAGVAWQRRGMTLAHREDVEGAHAAYRSAMHAWGHAAGHEEQAADAFYSLQAASALNARRMPDPDLRPFAAVLRGGAVTPVGRARRLERDAMSNRLAGQLPDALRDYWLALAIYRRVGSLQGVASVRGKLAELYAEADRAVEAVCIHIAAGHDKQAAELAANLTVDQLEAAVTVGPARWERSAAYRVLARVGHRLREPHIAQFAEQLLRDAEDRPTALAAPQPAIGAKLALARVVLGLPEDLRPRAWAVLRDAVRGQYIETVQAAALALVLATNVGAIDETELLVDVFLENPNARIDPGWVAERAPLSEGVRGRLREAALAGSTDALEALALADAITGDAELEAACTAATERNAGVTTIERGEAPREVLVSLGIPLEPGGLLARFATPEGRRRFVDRMVEIVGDSDEPESNRASAANALCNAAPSLTTEQATAIRNLAEPLALGHYGASPHDVDNRDPLSRFRIRLHRAGELRAAAIILLARLAAEGHGDADDLSPVIARALRDGSDVVTPAAFDALAMVQGSQSPVPLEAALVHPDERVQIAAIRAWGARHNSLPADDVLTPLLASPSRNVKVTLLNIAREATDGNRALTVLGEGGDSYLRGLARQKFN